MVQITADQLKLIRETWVNVTPALMQHGVNIFYAFFKKYPDNLKYFPKFHGVEVEKLKVCYVHGFFKDFSFKKIF